MKKFLRYKAYHDEEIIAGFGMIVWRTASYETDAERYKAEAAIALLGFDTTTIEEFEGTLFSGNLEHDEGQYLIFEGLTRDEIMELKSSCGLDMQAFYDRMSAEDQALFDQAFSTEEPLVGVHTEDLDTWGGPSLHI